jgi:hypothetical protein
MKCSKSEHDWVFQEVPSPWDGEYGPSGIYFCRRCGAQKKPNGIEWYKLIYWIPLFFLSILYMGILVPVLMLIRGIVDKIKNKK